MPAAHRECSVQSFPFGEPHGLEFDARFDKVRADEPLCRVRTPYGVDAWLVTRHEDVRTVLVDPRFSRAAGVGKDEPRITEDVQPRGILDMDPPNVTRMRRLVAGAFTARRVERLRTRALDIAHGLVDAIAPSGSADLVADYGFPLAVTMICELLGVPVGDRPEFETWSQALVSTTAFSPAERQAQIGELMAYMGGLVRRRREEPTDDLLGALVAARDGHGRLTEEEMVFLAGGLLAAGHETTATQIPNFVYVLLSHPDQLALLRSRPDLLPSAVEELMRWVPLTLSVPVPRWALEDIELSGGVVKAGEPVFAQMSAANRDPKVFQDPHRLDITRQPNPHVGFGYGIHHCLGAQLARLELQVAISVLFERLPGLEVAVADTDLDWRTGHALRGLLALPVRF
ncbi:cytochrome P450 [Kibdelosporangium lantanae]